MQEIDQIIDTRISVEWLILADAAEVTGGNCICSEEVGTV